MRLRAEVAVLREKLSAAESNSKNKKVEQVWDILIALAFTAGPFGFSVPILYSCISWGVAWLAFVHLIWNLEYLSGVNKWHKSAVAVLASTGLVGALYLPIRAAYTREKARATSGDLVAVDDGKDHSLDPPMLQIGPTGGVKFIWKGQPGDPMISAYYDKIHLKMLKGRVYLTTTVRDDNKNLIAEIVDNHWIVSSSTASCWDKNYTKDSLEVKDGHGRVVLQVRVLPNIVQLQVEWQWNAGTPFPGALTEDGKYDQKTGIKPMFRYPAEVYWGELVPDY